MVRNIVRSRELIWQLFKRDFLAGYKKSFIGIAWIFLSPLAGILSWVFLQKTGMLNPGQVGVPYPVYVLIGTSMWGLFMGFFSGAQATLSSGQALVMQVSYSRDALLFQQTAQHLANFLVAFLLNVVVLVGYGLWPSWKIIFFPLVAFPLFLMGAGIGLLTSVLSVVAVDVTRVVNMAMGLMLWVTPIIYSNQIENELVRSMIQWNPLTYLVCSARDLILYGRLYEPTGYFVCSAISLAVFLISWRLFYVSEDRVIERMI